MSLLDVFTFMAASPASDNTLNSPPKPQVSPFNGNKNTKDRKAYKDITEQNGSEKETRE